MILPFRLREFEFRQRMNKQPGLGTVAWQLYAVRRTEIAGKERKTNGTQK